jgi:hypothetical protein
VVKAMTGEIHRDMHHYQECSDPGGEGDPKSSEEAVAGYPVVGTGYRLYSGWLW